VKFDPASTHQRYVEEHTIQSQRITLLLHDDFTSAVDSEGRTALSLAAKYSEDDHITVVKYLLDLGVDVNSRDHSGRTVLSHFATSDVFRASIAIETLCRGGADPKIPDNAGKTPILLAAERQTTWNYYEVLAALAGSGADPNALDPLGKSLLELIVTGEVFTLS